MTVQIMDTMEKDGETYYVSGHLMALPISEAGLELMPQSTANWRGCVAKWKIEDDHLWLTEVSGVISEPEESNGKDVSEILFPSGFPVKADWVSGKVRVKSGDVVKYLANVPPIFEKEEYMVFEQGKLLSIVPAPDPRNRASLNI